jgi:hypothetical protein
MKECKKKRENDCRDQIGVYYSYDEKDRTITQMNGDPFGVGEATELGRMANVEIYKTNMKGRLFIVTV